MEVAHCELKWGISIKNIGRSAVSIEDHERRVEEYWYWRNREIDAQFDAQAAASSREIDRLLSGEELEAKYGSRRSRSSSDSTEANVDSTSESDPSDSIPTAEEQFNEHSERLFVALRNSTFLPTDTTRKWINQIKEITKCTPSRGLKILALIASEYRHARHLYKPQRDVWDLGVHKEMLFDTEMDIIKRELDWLEAILNHVDACLRE
jgi:hypothetical protein